MIAIDTNLLVYAHREDSDFHEAAIKSLVSLAESGRRWGIPWPCLHEFVSIVTHAAIYKPPTPLPLAFDTIRMWMECPQCEMIGEGPGYFEKLQNLALAGRVQGPMIHDARVAAICLDHGVNELWTADRDFTRYGALKIHNPLIIS